LNEIKKQKGNPSFNGNVSVSTGLPTSSILVPALGLSAFGIHATNITAVATRKLPFISNITSIRNDSLFVKLSMDNGGLSNSFGDSSVGWYLSDESSVVLMEWMLIGVNGALVYRICDNANGYLLCSTDIGMNISTTGISFEMTINPPVLLSGLRARYDYLLVVRDIAMNVSQSYAGSLLTNGSVANISLFDASSGGNFAINDVFFNNFTSCYQLFSASTTPLPTTAIPTGTTAIPTGKTLYPTATMLPTATETIAPTSTLSNTNPPTNTTAPKNNANQMFSTQLWITLAIAIVFVIAL